MHGIDLKKAESDDIALVLSMLKNFYVEDRIPFDEERVQSGLSQLVDRDESGSLLLITNDDNHVIGYVILGWCFSVEYGGRYLLLDEFYLIPAVRGRGLGRTILKAVIDYSRKNNACALRLEVNHHNTGAHSYTCPKVSLMTSAEF